MATTELRQSPYEDLLTLQELADFEYASGEEQNAFCTVHKATFDDKTQPQIALVVLAPGRRANLESLSLVPQC